MNRALPAASLLFMAASTAVSQTIPPVQTKTLDGAAVVLPGDQRTKPVLLLVGFSHKSDDDFRKWAALARKPFVSDSRIDYYELVDLQGVPSLINKVIVHGMRQAIAEPRKAHFAPFCQHEAEWKTLVHCDEPAVAYVMLADAQGHVLWQGKGPATEARALELESMISKLPARAR